MSNGRVLLLITHCGGTEVQFHPTMESAECAAACFAVDCSFELSESAERAVVNRGRLGDASGVVDIYFTHHPRDRMKIVENAYLAEAQLSSRDELIEHATLAHEAWDFLDEMLEEK